MPDLVKEASGVFEWVGNSTVNLEGSRWGAAW